MKLNLLPQTASKGRQLRTATIFAVVLVLASAALAVFMVSSSAAAFAAAKDKAEGLKAGAANALATSQEADTVAASAEPVVRNTNLAEAMLAHNEVYPKLYDDIKPYIPSFFRVNSMSAAPVDATTARVTLVGTLSSYEQYADVVLALMRFKDAKSISRSGYNLDDTIVPPLSTEDTVGEPRRRSQQPIPSDQIERLTYYESQRYPSGYQGTGNFGDGQDDTKGATPNESLVTIVLTVSRDLQVPSVESTLTGAGGGGAAGMPGLAGFGAAGGPPGGPPGGAPGGPPGMAGRPGAVGGGRGGAGGD